MRSVDEIEKDFEAGRKKAKQREEEREAKLEKNYQRSLERSNKKMATAVEDLRDKYEKSADSRAQLDRAQRDDMKANLYDRAGRSMAASVSDAEAERDRAVQSAGETQERYQKASSQAENYYERRAQENQERYAEKLEELQENYREELKKARSKDPEAEQKATAEYKAKVQREAQNAVTQAHELLQEERRKSLEMNDAHHRETRTRETKNDRLLESRLHNQDRRHIQELEDSARHTQQSRASETGQLREQLGEMTRFASTHQKDKNTARAEAIRELESDWRSQMENMTTAHSAETRKTKENAKESEQRTNKVYNDALREKDARTAALVSRQNLDHAKQMSDAVSGYDRAKKQIELQAQRSVEHANQAASSQRQSLIEAKDDALARQASTYQEVISRQKKADQSQIKNLERILTHQNTTDDPGEISAAAEAAIRGQMEAKYGKTFQAEAQRNRNEIDHLAAAFDRDLDEARTQAQYDKARLHQDTLLEKQRTQGEFMSHIQDVEDSKMRLMQHSQQQSEKTRDAMTQLGEKSLNETRRHYEDLLAERKMESDYKFSTLRQSTEFEKKQMRREFITQTNDMIRGYEKQLDDQRTQYEDQLRELRARTEAQARDNDKRLRQALEQQERSYNQRLAETEIQHRERERLIAQQHEDQLDKVKRSNALLLAKKG